MASLKYSANSSLQTVTLGSAYTSGSGSMILTTGHGARLPSSGDFWLAYDNGAGVVRLFKVTARSTDTLTVTADATEGSGDGNISSGETLRWALTAAALDQLKADIVASGALVLLESETASSSASLDFTSISSTYDTYKIEIIELLPATDGAAIYIEVSTDGGGSYITTSSYNYSSYALTGSGGGSNGSISANAIAISVNQDSSTGQWAFSASLTLYNPLGTTNYTGVSGLGYGVTNAGVGIGNVCSWVIAGSYKSTTAVDAFRVKASSGNLASGIVRLYGVAK